MEFHISGGNQGAKLWIDNKLEKDGILFFEVNMSLESEQIPESFKIKFYTPCVDIYSMWSPNMGFERALRANWNKKTTSSRLTCGMPLRTLVSSEGKNRMSVAISDAKTPLEICSGVCEESALIEWELTFFTIKVAPLKKYKTTVRIDMRDIAYYDSIYDVVSWWENACGYHPAYVPESARFPMNSLWYSFHQQLDVEEIIKECKLSKAIGMDTVIVDDGWQTEDNSRGYQFCGDWEVASSKIPDIKDFVSRIHSTGMKVMLWFSVPYVGVESKIYNVFRDMLLDHPNTKRDAFSLDPRYKKVRDYLIGIYSKAVREWGFDGLKLDFISAFVLYGKSLEFDTRRDHISLEDAIDTLMTDITNTLRSINPEVLIEFRQPYVGPAIRKYGNMLRVADCPNDPILNRLGVIDLRLTSGKTAVHSDMLMWNRDDRIESAALQFINVLYSVPQISVKLTKLSAEHKKMLEFYLSFWRENRNILIDGKLLAPNPENIYSIVCAEKDSKAIFTCYCDTLVDCSSYAEVIAMNASRHSALILKGADSKEYTVLDCIGNTVEKGTVQGSLCEIKVPLAGMVCICS